jgi:GNAT superfamily N-acetyltransferase
MNDTGTGKYAVRELTPAQIAGTYQNEMTRDFPADELKPLRRITDALSRGGYACFGLFDGDKQLAYAFFVIAGREYLLDYFAVCPSCRGTGIGSAFLAMLKPLLSEAEIIIIEVEHPDYASDAADRQMRERRRAFYLRGGCCDTGAEACVFGTEYRLLEMPLSEVHAQETVRAAYLRLYQSLLPPVMFRQNIRLHG